MLSSPEQKQSSGYESVASDSNHLRKLIIRRISIFLIFIALIGFLAYKMDITIPGSPAVSNTFTPITQATAQEIGSYDVLGKVVSKDEAASLLKTETGKNLLSAENGAIEVNNKLIKLGRKSFYTETFGNEFDILQIIT